VRQTQTGNTATNSDLGATPTVTLQQTSPGFGRMVEPTLQVNTSLALTLVPAAETAGSTKPVGCTCTWSNQTVRQTLNRQYRSSKQTTLHQKAMMQTANSAPWCQRLGQPGPRSQWGAPAPGPCAAALRLALLPVGCPLLAPSHRWWSAALQLPGCAPVRADSGVGSDDHQHGQHGQQSVCVGMHVTALRNVYVSGKVWCCAFLQQRVGLLPVGCAPLAPSPRWWSAAQQQLGCTPVWQCLQVAVSINRPAITKVLCISCA
jgi:hypothetical protein